MRPASRAITGRLPPWTPGASVNPAAGAPRASSRVRSSAPTPRWLLVVPAERAQAAWQAVTAVAEPIGTADWRRTEVLAGVPRIVPGTYEQFVPQMLNFESVDGVSFRKGCYPGQEIVARSQYLGKLKRRMFVGHGEGPEPAPGSDVTPADGGEPCGQVVIAAPDPAGGFDLLFECPVCIRRIRAAAGRRVDAAGGDAALSAEVDRVAGCGAGRAVRVYVYYEAAATDDARVGAAFERLVQGLGGAGPRDRRAALLRRFASLQSGLARREPGPAAVAPQATTWMEVYEGIDAAGLPAWLDRLDSVAAQSGLTDLARGPRHVEVFEPVRPAGAPSGDA